MSRWRGTGRWILAGAGLAGLVVWGWSRRAVTQGAPAGAEVPAAVRLVPDGTRIRVEAQNGTATRGLARRATRALRDAGFDVVSSGNAEAPTDSSVVYMHGGRRDWAELAARALGGARIVARPDSSRHLDLTIVVGRAWRPPRDPFDP